MSDGVNPGGPTPPPPPPAAPPPPPPAAPQAPPPPPPYGAPGSGSPNPQPGWTAAPVPTTPAPTGPPPGYPQPGYQQPGYQQPGYQQPAYGYGTPPPYMAPNYDMRPKRSGGAITALVFGLLSIPLFFVFVPAIVAFVVGLVAAHSIKKSNGARTGLGMARAGWILGFLSFAGMTTLVVLIATGVIESDTNVNDLEAGQCVDLDGGDSDTVFSLPTTDCAEPHSGEVYHVGTLDRFDASADYPGQRRVQAAVELQCVGRVFTDYVGVDYNESEYQLYSLSPSEDSWGGGDRSFICIAQGTDGDLVGSVRGTRR